MSREADKYKDLLRHSNEQLESLKKKVTKYLFELVLSPFGLNTFFYSLELDAEKQRKEVKRLENLVKDLKKYLKKSTIENHRDEILDIFDDAIECYNNAMKRAEEAEVT